MDYNQLMTLTTAVLLHGTFKVATSVSDKDIGDALDIAKRIATQAAALQRNW